MADPQQRNGSAATAADQVTDRPMRDDAMLEVRNLRMYFPIRAGLFQRVVNHVRAVDGVNLFIRPGETLGLVGESGCGKTTTGRCIIRAYEPLGGQILFRREDGDVVDLAPLDDQSLREYHRQIRMIFQDPYSSLNPRMPVVDLVGEPMKVNKMAKGQELEDRVADLLRRVGLRPEYMKRYPHAFSGGERQRIGIARALSLDPRLVLCDEAVSALDVSVRAQILNLLEDLQQRPRPDLPVYRPRPERGGIYLRPGGGDVCGQAGRVGLDRRALCPAPTSLHRGAAFRRAPARPAAPRSKAADQAGRRGRRPGPPAQRLLFSSPLPVQRWLELRERDARAARDDAAALCGVSLCGEVEFAGGDGAGRGLRGFVDSPSRLFCLENRVLNSSSGLCFYSGS